MTDSTAVALPAIGHNNPPPMTRAEELAERFAPLLKRFAEIKARSQQFPEVVENEKQSGEAAELGLDAAELFNELEEKRKAENEPFRVVVGEINSFFALYTEPLKANKKGAVPGIADTLAKKVGDYMDRVAAAERRRQQQIADDSRAAAQRQLEEAAAKEKAGRPVPAIIGLDIAEAHERRAEEAEARVTAPVAELARSRTATSLATASEPWTGVVENRDELDIVKLRPLLKLDELNRAVREWAKKNPGGKLAGARIYQETKASFRRR